MACLHDHSCEEQDCSSDWSLYKHIDLSKVYALNEAVPGGVKSVFRAWEQRLNSTENLVGAISRFRRHKPRRIMACLHDHSCEEHDCSSDWSLYKHIDLSKVYALNEAVSGGVKSVFRAWEQRLNSTEGYMESNEGDPELIVFIPFTSDVKIKSISVVGGADGTSPAKMRAFINRDGIDFSDAQNMQPVQEWDLVENLQGVLEYQTRYSRFQSVGNITLHFPDNFGGDTTQIHYIGLKGEATQLKRDVVATIVYELMPNPSDHKTHAETGGSLSHVG